MSSMIVVWPKLIEKDGTNRMLKLGDQILHYKGKVLQLLWERMLDDLQATIEAIEPTNVGGSAKEQCE